MIPARRLYLTALGLGCAAAACLVVALLRRHSLLDAGFPTESAHFERVPYAPTYAGVFSYDGNLFDPFHPLNAYLWLGAAAAFGFAALVVAGAARLAPAVRVWHGYVVAAVLAAAGMGSLVVALLRRHSLTDVIGTTAAASAAKGRVAYSPLSASGNLLDPFRPLNAYLWLGAASAFALSALVLAGIARLASRG